MNFSFPAAHSICGMEWSKSFRKSCYKISSAERSWNNAKRDCESQGAHLLKIDDRDEQSYFNTVLRKLHLVGKTNDNCN